MPDDTQADLTERARRLTQKLAKHFIGEQFAAEDETCQQCVAMVEAALQSEREAAAAEARRVPDCSSLYFPLLKLANESDAILGLCREVIRETAGNTNLQIFERRIAEASVALASLASPPTPQEGAMIHPDQQGWRPKCVCPIGWCSVKIDGLHPYPSRCRDAKPERPPAPQEEKR